MQMHFIMYNVLFYSILPYIFKIPCSQFSSTKRDRVAAERTKRDNKIEFHGLTKLRIDK